MAGLTAILTCIIRRGEEMKKRIYGIFCVLCITVASFSQEAVAVEPQNQMAENLSSDLKPLPPVIVGPQEQPMESQPSNTTMKTAVQLVGNKLYSDEFTRENNKRYYKFQTEKMSLMAFGVNSKAESTVRLLDGRGRQLTMRRVNGYGDFDYYKMELGEFSLLMPSVDSCYLVGAETVEPGNYYIEVSIAKKQFSKKVTSIRVDVMGDVEPLEPFVKLGRMSSVYTGKKIKMPSVKLVWKREPSVDQKYLDSYDTIYDMRTGKKVKSIKKIGRYIISTKYYEPDYGGDGCAIFTVTPQKGVIKNVKSKKRGQIQVTAKSNTAAGRYQIQVSTDRSFEKDVKEINTKNTRQIVKKLKSKQTYYVRLRYYKNVSKKYVYGQSKPQPIYGAWSKTKTVICK